MKKLIKITVFLMCIVINYRLNYAMDVTFAAKPQEHVQTNHQFPASSVEKIATNSHVESSQSSANSAASPKQLTDSQGLSLVESGDKEKSTLNGNIARSDSTQTSIQLDNPANSTVPIIATDSHVTPKAESSQSSANPNALPKQLTDSQGVSLVESDDKKESTLPKSIQFDKTANSTSSNKKPPIPQPIPKPIVVYSYTNSYLDKKMYLSDGSTITKDIVQKTLEKTLPYKNLQITNIENNSDGSTTRTYADGYKRTFPADYNEADANKKMVEDISDLNNERRRDQEVLINITHNVDKGYTLTYTGGDTVTFFLDSKDTEIYIKKDILGNITETDSLFSNGDRNTERYNTDGKLILLLTYKVGDRFAQPTTYTYNIDGDGNGTVVTLDSQGNRTTRIFEKNKEIDTKKSKDTWSNLPERVIQDLYQQLPTLTTPQLLLSFTQSIIAKWLNLNVKVKPTQEEVDTQSKNIAESLSPTLSLEKFTDLMQTLSLNLYSLFIKTTLTENAQKTTPLINQSSTLNNVPA